MINTSISCNGIILKQTSQFLVAKVCSRIFIGYARTYQQNTRQTTNISLQSYSDIETSIYRIIFIICGLTIDRADVFAQFFAFLQCHSIYCAFIYHF